MANGPVSHVGGNNVESVVSSVVGMSLIQEINLTNAVQGFSCKTLKGEHLA